jgi:hypothetical protein
LSRRLAFLLFGSSDAGPSRSRCADPRRAR